MADDDDRGEVLLPAVRDTRSDLQAIAARDREPPASYIEALNQRADDNRFKSMRPNTARAYESRWARFRAWCAEQGVSPLPATVPTVRAYVVHRVEVDQIKARSVRSDMAALAAAHSLANLPSPTEEKPVRDTLKDLIKKDRGSRVKKLPLLNAMLVAAYQPPLALADIQDWALLVFGRATACRRSELVALEVRHLTFLADRVLVLVENSKTDREGLGDVVTIMQVPGGGPACPVACLRTWLEAASVTSGPVFRRLDRRGNVTEHGAHDQWAARAVKRAIRRAGLNPMQFAGHSLRRGYVTEAVLAGAPDGAIMPHTRHRDPRTLQGYKDDATLFAESNPGMAIQENLAEALRKAGK